MPEEGIVVAAVPIISPMPPEIMPLPSVMLMLESVKASLELPPGALTSKAPLPDAVDCPVYLLHVKLATVMLLLLLTAPLLLLEPKMMAMPPAHAPLPSLMCTFETVIEFRAATPKNAT